MSNWRVFSKSQDEELQPELELDFSLSQLPVRTLLPFNPAPLHERPQEEAGPSRPPKQPRVEQRWHGNLQQDARALVILLQVGCVEPGTRDVTFGGIFEGLNDNQYSCCLRPVKGSRGHQRWLEGPVNPLTKAARADFVALILQRILKFLQME
ncbi:hypothetical protein M758_4G185300 [Ceratodon purpureus]|nr:hypothetical protein M758_4G185000 [Ceratodon purpureus]KAG0620051.1 hypothetical protein M758_4G185300 [Ceratodon purpureus]